MNLYLIEPASVPRYPSTLKQLAAMPPRLGDGHDLTIINDPSWRLMMIMQWSRRGPNGVLTNPPWVKSQIPWEYVDPYDAVFVASRMWPVNVIDDDGPKGGRLTNFISRVRRQAYNVDYDCASHGWQHSTGQRVVMSPAHSFGTLVSTAAARRRPGRPVRVAR